MASTKSHQTSRKTQFHSKFYSPFPGEVASFFEQHRIPTKPGTTSLELMCKCPKCSKAFSAAVDQVTGKFGCQKCGTRGTWSDILASFDIAGNGIDIEEAVERKEPMSDSKENVRFTKLDLESYTMHLWKERRDLVEKLERMGFNQDTIRAYHVGVAYKAVKTKLSLDGDWDSPYWIFPRYVSRDHAVMLPSQFRAMSCKTPTKASLYAVENVQGELQTGLTGLPLTASNPSQVVITGSEFAAMAIYQSTGIPTLCLPRGSTQLPLDILPRLESFSKIYLWLEGDQSVATSEKFAHKLGLSRTWICTSPIDECAPPWTSVMNALAQGRASEIAECVQRASRLGHREIETFQHLRQHVRYQLHHPEAIRGVPSRDFPTLTKILKGHRPGELTILTGGTGVGKTTVLSQLSLDWCRWGGVPTLWGSFEIGNVRLVTRMMCQFAGRDLSKREQGDIVSDFDAVADQFEHFHGSTNVDSLLSAMHHARYAYDVSHIILDNLQFMLSGQARTSSLDRWELQDDAVALLRRFATENQVHVTLVVHPRKEDREQLELNSVFGSVKVVQEADNVIMVQKVDGQSWRCLEVKKNRFDGTLGVVPYRFDPDAQKAVELTPDEVVSLKRKHRKSSSSYK